MFIPNLKHIFCIPRVYESNHLVPMLRYLNDHGIIPPVLIGAPGVYDILDGEGIRYDAIRDLPADYDIFITCGQGYLTFDGYWLEKSMEAGKINLEFMLYSSLNNFENPFYIPKRTKFIHAMFVNDKRTADNLKALNREILHLNTGSPIWDEYPTDEFKQQVSKVKKRYGEKLLVVGASNHRIPQEMDYCEKIVQWGKSLGFNVMLQLHPELMKSGFSKKRFKGNVNLEFRNHVMFAAASHAISFIHSAMTPDCLYFGAKVGCKPQAFAIEGGEKSFWCEDSSQWYKWARTYFDEDVLDVLPLIHDAETLANFLDLDNKASTKQAVEKIFDWPKVPSITENIYRTIEAYFGKDNQDNVKKMLRKNEINKGIVIDFSFWDLKKDLSQFYGVNDLQDFIKGGVQFLNQNRIWDAFNFFRRAEMFSGTSHVEFVQYALAICYFNTGNIEDADKYIYRSLMFNPDKDEYLALKAKIDEKKRQNCELLV